jgi:hypothetical protein
MTNSWGHWVPQQSAWQFAAFAVQLGMHGPVLDELIAELAAIELDAEAVDAEELVEASGAQLSEHPPAPITLDVDALAVEVELALVTAALLAAPPAPLPPAPLLSAFSMPMIALHAARAPTMNIQSRAPRRAIIAAMLSRFRDQRAASIQSLCPKRR